MRWLPLLGCVVCALGCGKQDAPLADADRRWVITGTEPARILLTNGKFAFWVDTNQGAVEGGALLFVDGALARVGWLGDRLLAPPKGDHRWTFDLRTGELRSRTGNEEIRAVIHPTLHVGAVQVNRDTGTGLGRTTPELLIRDEVAVQPYSSSQDQGVFELTQAKADHWLTYEEVRQASADALKEFWRTDIQIDGPAEDQLAIRTMLYYVRRGATPKMPPFGASNAKYRGARFWDAEAWILPVLALTDPEMAAEATKWRTDNLGVKIPWEAAVGGKDVAPREFSRALHVAGWAAWWMNRARILGLATAEDESRVLDIALRQFREAVVETPRGLEIRQIESPDEGKLRDNDLVTNLLAQRVAEWADGPDWKGAFHIPRTANGLPAAYDNDPLLGYQQTAALLAIYPLEEHFGGEVEREMFDRYAGLVTEVGPAMGESIHATIAARQRREDAYSRWRTSWQTYTDAAMMFHERRNKQDAYFMTGAAGCLQTLLYGFAGIYIETDGPPEADAVVPLADGYRVAFRPSIPSEWRSITLRNVFLGPNKATVRIDHSGVTIEGG